MSEALCHHTNVGMVRRALMGSHGHMPTCRWRSMAGAGVGRWEIHHNMIHQQHI